MTEFGANAIAPPFCPNMGKFWPFICDRGHEVDLVLLLFMIATVNSVAAHGDTVDLLGANTTSNTLLVFLFSRESLPSTLAPE